MNVYGSALSSGAGGIDYSTSEQDTGLKWTDGKKLYQRTYTGTLGTGATTTIASVSSYNIKSIQGVYYSSSGLHANPALTVANNTVYYALAYVTSGGQLTVETNALYSNTYNLTITYTK